MMKRTMILAVLMVLVLLTAVPGTTQAPLKQVGYINLKFSTLAAGVGFTWGQGSLFFRGKQIPVKVTGMNVAAVGFSEVTAIGRVFNLTKPEDIQGTYLEAGAGIAVSEGVKGLLARNEKGVVIDLSATQKGVSLNIGPGGFTLTLR
jgi:hypothetical protein